MDKLNKKIDLHMHSTVSDGTDTPEEILAFVKKEGIEIFSVTDHDAVKAGKILKEKVSKDDPVFITGAEFSCKDEGGKYHILGYGFDPDHKAILDVVNHGHSLRMGKVLKRIDFLNDEFKISFPEEELNKLMSMDNPGKPHIANLMVKYGYAKSKEDAFNNYLNLIRFSSEYIRPEEAIEGILKAGGIPVLAHPFYGSGDELFLGEEMEERIVHLLKYGLQGVEAFYSGFTDKLRRQMVEYAEKYNLYVTAGSDYHGTNKLVKLGDTGLDVTDKYPRQLKRFLNAVIK